LLQPKAHKKRGGSYEYWTRAITKAGQVGRSTAGKLLALWGSLYGEASQRLGDIIPGGSILNIVLGRNNIINYYYNIGSNSMIYFGVDSSRTKPVPVGIEFVAFISAAAIRLDQGLSNSTIVHLDVEPSTVPNVADLSKYKLELTINMFEMELKALRKAQKEALNYKKSAVVLDGPLVDPPGLAKRLRNGDPLIQKAKNVVVDRADSIATLYLHDVPVVGFVKRLQGSIFLDKYLPQASSRYPPGTIGDRLVSLVIASAMQEKADKLGLCSSGYRFVAVTKPIELDQSVAPDVDYYVSVASSIVGRKVRVYTSLYIPGWCDGNYRRPGRIEFLAEPGKEAEQALRAAALLEATVTPGTYMPLPVYLAHTSCTIRRREGAKLLREAASRHALETLQSSPGLPLRYVLSGLFGGVMS